MAKLILATGDTVLREIALSSERVTIGRRPHNDIVLNDPAISGDHAVIVIRENTPFLEDLNSTNGTQVNGQPVKRHLLQHGDTIKLAGYKIRYVAGYGDDIDGEPRQTRIAPLDCSPASEAIDIPAGSASAVARLSVLNGPNAGRELALAKVLTTLGRPKVQVAVITRQHDGFYLTHIEGVTAPLINGYSIGSDAHQLANGDVIDMSGTLVAFSAD